MIKYKRSSKKLLISSTIILSASISGCSTFSQVGKSARSLTSFGQQSGGVAVNESLIIPPSLKMPGAAPRAAARTPRTSARQTNQKRPQASNYSGRNYYVVVGTYGDQPQAFDTFVRLSSIGLPGATMESRKAKSGKMLHMVRLGPYQKQESIDKVTNSLTSDGLTQFKVVEN